MKLTELFRINRKPNNQDRSSKQESQVAVRQRDYLKLFQLMRGHHLLQLRVMGDDQPYQTMLLEVNADSGYLVIDEPFPADGLLSGRFQQNVILEYEAEGFCTRIQSVVCERLEEEGDRYFRLEWPTKVEEIQRRDQFRLDVTGCWMDGISVDNVENQQVSAVLDLSSSGMRLAFEGNQIDSIYAGSYLQNIVLSLKGCDPINCCLDITHCHYVPNAELGDVEMTVAGGRLVGLSVRESQAIERFIFSAQRVQRRVQLAETDAPAAQYETRAA
ncbi:MAG: flagellar brake protein [Pseudomonadales bacterium]|nr:flagellar brake protein [Pseudomonadales bacterium]